MSKRLTMKDFGETEKVTWDSEGKTGSVPYVPETRIREIMSPAMYEKFDHWMRGQTVCGPGPYPWDLERFLSLYDTDGNAIRKEHWSEWD